MELAKTAEDTRSQRDRPHGCRRENALSKQPSTIMSSNRAIIAKSVGAQKTPPFLCRRRREQRQALTKETLSNVPDYAAAGGLFVFVFWGG